MPLLSRKTQVAVKHETAEGTALTLAAANMAFNVFETGYSTDIEQFERNPFRSTVGTRASIPGVKQGSISYTTELVGTGSAPTAASPPPFGPALQSCGFQVYEVKKLTGTVSSGPFVVGETLSGLASATVRAVDGNDLYITTTASSDPSGSVSGGTSSASMTSGTLSAAVGLVYGTISTYVSSTTPSEVSAPACTVGLFNDGLKHRIKGARGNVTFRATTGQPLQMQFEFTGTKLATADDGLKTGVAYPTDTPPTLLNASFTTHGHSSVLDSVEISTGNDLQTRRSVNDAAGLISTQIVSRAVTGNIDPEMTLIDGELDWFGTLDANTEGVTRFDVGSAVGNSFKVFGNKSQFVSISPGDRNGIAIATVELAFNESTLGDDDLQIVCL